MEMNYFPLQQVYTFRQEVQIPWQFGSQKQPQKQKVAVYFYVKALVPACMYNAMGKFAT